MSLDQPPMLSAGQHPAFRDLGPSWYRVMGIDRDGGGVPSSMLEYGKQPADEAWVYSCMAKKAGAVAGVPLRVQVREESEGEQQWTDVEETTDSDGTELQYLLDDFNPGWDGARAQAYTEAGATIHGGSYWQKVRGRLGGRPQQLYWLSGALVKPVMGRSFPTSYDYTPQPQALPTPIEAKDVVPFLDTINLANPFELLSPLSSVRYEIATNSRAAQWNASVLGNWSIPPGVWMQKENAEVTPEDRRFFARLMRSIRGPRAAGKTPIVPWGFDFKELAMSPKDADWIASRKVSRMAICAITGVPLVLAGDDEKNTVYAAVRDAQRVLWQLTLIPEMDQRAARLNSFLVPDFDPGRAQRKPARIRVAYDYHGIEALRAAPAEDMAQTIEAVKLGLPMDQYTDRFGFKRVKGGSESRVFLGRGGDVPLADDLVAAGTTTAKEAEAGATLPAPAKPASTPRPEEYSASSSRTADLVGAFGKNLYKHPAVKAWIADPSQDLATASLLGDPCPDAARAVIETGLRQRASAAVIAERLREGAIE